jgi:hypothetical protein
MCGQSGQATGSSNPAKQSSKGVGAASFERSKLRAITSSVVVIWFLRDKTPPPSPGDKPPRPSRPKTHITQAKPSKTAQIAFKAILLSSWLTCLNFKQSTSGLCGAGFGELGLPLPFLRLPFPSTCE